MLRNKLIEKGNPKDPEFRWRSDKVTRLEGFSDAVLAFAMTLLVVSLEVPKTYDQLLVAMRGFVAFAICFIFLVGIWYSHYTYFRRYGIITPYTVCLNAVLMFVILFYVYPLKFLFTTLVNFFWGITTVALSDGTVANIISGSQMPTLMIIYGIGYMAVFIVFALLYIHAFRKRELLDLNAIETHITREFIQRKFIYIAFGIISICLAVVAKLLAAPFFGAMSGWIYALIGPAIAIHATRMATAREKMAEKKPA